ncbi:unnamed protein product [Effrenium voratum]|nr:unnamed protein product [Effrenium voratum]
MAELAEATEPQATEAEAHDAFMFPSALKPTDLQLEDESSEEDEDTDGPNDQGVMSSIYSSKMFSDPEEYEKWKNRGWRAVQCCGGALLVLALIFDEMD